MTYWVGAEAPVGNANIEEPVGSITDLRQVQSFVKRAEDASLSFTISAAFVEASDRNAIMHRLCPPEHAYTFGCDLILAEVRLDVEALRHTDAPNQFDRFFHRTGLASINGYAENWDIRTFTPPASQGPLWKTEDFDVVVEDDEGAREGLALMTLRQPRQVTIDLTAVEVGETFTVQSFATATAYNRIGGPPSEFESSATAFLRDPQGIDGTTLQFAGLEPTAPPTGAVDDDDVQEPAPCPAPDPTAGAISFDAAEAPTVSEAGRTTFATIVRTGGSDGAVTATLRTSDGSATAGSDYEPVATTVHFADGDTTPRTAEVPILADTIPDEVDETVLLTLSDPGGCATLGDPAQTTLTIRDDDDATPTGIGAIDESYGTAGRAATTRFGGSPAAMAVQDDGKAVMTGGSFTDYRLARFDVDGRLDPTFDGDGMATTDLVADNGFTTERATAIAIAPDDRIVIAGETEDAAGGSTFAVLRYLPDGSLDTAFGDGGLVAGLVPGGAASVAVQPDGRIVAAGRVTSPAGDEDIVVARFLTDGSLDPGFGDAGTGTRVIDIGAGAGNEAQRVLVAPDGTIVVSGSALNPGGPGFGIFHHTDVVRLDAEGDLDPTFGAGTGTVTLAEDFVGAGVARQADGSLVLVGSVDVSPSPSQFVHAITAVRLDASGAVDQSFGTAGRVVLDGTGGLDAGAAVAVQADGRLVVVGQGSSINENFLVTRLDENGDVDTSFGDEGTLLVDFFRFTDVPADIAIDGAERILVGGQAEDDFDGFGVVRILP